MLNKPTEGVLGGLGMGLTFLTSVGVPATYFLKRRALATGIVTTGASLGGIVYPIVFEYLLEKYGFRWALRVLGFMAVSLPPESVSFPFRLSIFRYLSPSLSQPSLPESPRSRGERRSENQTDNPPDLNPRPILPPNSPTP